MNKQNLLNRIIEELQKEEAALLEASRSAAVAATEAEAKPENKYDTRGLEQSYLAAGQAKRAVDLKTSILKLRSLSSTSFDSMTPIDITAIVHLRSDSNESKIYFILPERGGSLIFFENQEIQTLSPESPLGELLFGKREGDSIDLKIKGENRSFFIERVQ